MATFRIREEKAGHWPDETPGKREHFFYYYLIIILLVVDKKCGFALLYVFSTFTTLSAALQNFSCKNNPYVNLVLYHPIEQYARI